MKPKRLSLLLIFAFVCSLLPFSASAAEEKSVSGGVKIGLTRGDIVYFAGKDEPMAWRVLDAEKTNTEDESGFLLLSDSVSCSASHAASSYYGMHSECESFFADYFASIYRDAAMTVSCDDPTYVFSGDEMGGGLKDDRIFALSAAEAEKLTAEEKEFNTSWWLRTGYLEKRTIIGWHDADFLYVKKGDGSFHDIKPGPYTSILLRPAVNLKKSAVDIRISDTESAPLLLPSGDKTASDGKFAAYENTGAWSLCMRDENVSITKAYTDGSPETVLRAYVSTSVESPTDSDYIAFVLRKENGDIAYYARVKQENTDGYYTLALPSDVDWTNDSLYVFHETDKDGFSSLVTDFTELCLAHDFGKGESVSETEHRITCSACGYFENVRHTIEYALSDDETHRKYCTECAYTGEAEAHTFVYTESAGNVGGVDMVKGTCGVCKAENGIYAGEGAVSESAASSRSVYGTEYITGKDYMPDASSALFRENTQNAVIEGVSGDGGYYAEISVDMNAPTCIYGIRFRESNRSYSTFYYSSPRRIILCGYGENGYEEIAEIPLEIFPDREPESVHSFLITKNTAVYTKFSLRFIAGTEDIVCGNLILLGRPGTQPTFSLTGTVVADKSDAVVPYEDYICELVTRTGYPTADEVYVLNGEELYENYTYDAQSGKLTLPAANRPEDASFTICAAVRDTPFSVRTVLTALNSDGDTSAWFGEDYTAHFTDRSGTDRFVPRKGAECVVTIGGEAFEDYTLEGGVLTIPGRYITGDIVITAEEAGLTRRDSTAVTVQFKDEDFVRYFDSLADAFSYGLDGELTATLLRDTYENVSLSGLHSVSLDLNGYAWKKYDREAPLLTVSDSSCVHIRNGKIGNGGLDLPPYITVKNNGSVGILDGVVFDTYDWDRNDDMYVVTVEAGGTLSVSNGTIYCSVMRNKNEGRRIFSAAVLVKDYGRIFMDGKSELYGLVLEPSAMVGLSEGTIYGFITRSDGGFVDYFGMLDTNSALSKVKAEQIGSYIDGSYTDKVILAADPGIISRQPESLELYAAYDFARTETISVKANGTDVRYTWYKNGELLPDETTDTVVVGTSDTPKVDTYICYIYSDGYLKRSNTAIVWYSCRHAVFDSDNICSACGEKVIAQVDFDDGWKRYDDFNSLTQDARKAQNAKITLLCDVSESYVSFYGENVVLDLNRHTLSVRSAYVYGNLTIRNGTVKGTVSADSPDSGFLTIEDGNYEDIQLYFGHALLKGGTFGHIGNTYGAWDSYLLPGYGFRNMDDRTFPDLAYFHDLSIENMEVMPLPYIITTVPHDTLAEIGSENTLEIAIEKAQYCANAEVSYQWYEATVLYFERTGPYLRKATAIEGATAPTFTLPTDLPNGTQKIYAVTVSCYGCERTLYVTVSFGVGTPRTEEADLYRYPEGLRPYFCINSAGNDCVAVLCMYSDGVLKDVYYVPISKTDFYRVLTEENLGYLKDVNEVRVLFVSDFAGLKPLAPTETVTP